MSEETSARTSLRGRAYRIIFGAETPAGKAFDVVLILAILLSVTAVMLESIEDISARYGPLLYRAEWFFTILFTVEYALRIWTTDEPVRYTTSFYGLVDLLAIIPTYASVLIPGAQYLLVIRLLRILRVFRVLKLMTYLSEATLLVTALRASRRKIEVFIFAVLTLVTVLGSLMYLVEGVENGFTSIPRSIYWAIVTLTTVGYGDISPQTSLGQTLAAIIMIMGYGIIAVPTGIVTVELSRAGQKMFAAGGASGDLISRETRYRDRSVECASCGSAPHDADAAYCKHCGEALEPFRLKRPSGP